MSEISQSTLTEIHYYIRQCMLDPDDFSVEIIEQQQGHVIIEIQHISNGAAKRYKQGAGCEFPIDFCFDVSSGVFSAG